VSDGFDEAWQQLHPAFQRSLQLAHLGVRSGGLAVGCVITNADDDIVAEGRNRAYDPPGGDDVLQGTPVAHAEMNALAQARTDWDLGDHTLWSTHEPCLMCRAAAAFVGVGNVRYIAGDPSAAGEPTSAHALPTDGPLDTAWADAANLLFLLSVAAKVGVDSTMVAEHRRRQPALVDLVVDAMGEPSLPTRVTVFLAPRWSRLVATR
jgi:tRNA(Arg) A34 adenosine deaminase TadA